MEQMAVMVVHFTDGTKVSFRYPKLQDSATLATKIKKALEQDKIVVQTYDSLLVIGSSLFQVGRANLSLPPMR